MGDDLKHRELGGERQTVTEGGLDPRDAARLLADSELRARRELEWRSPWLSLIAAIVVFAAFGAIWLTVRGQHPYKGPTLLSLVVLWALVAIRIATVVYSHRHASSGVSGRSARQRRAEGWTLLVSLCAVYVVMAALANAGASNGLVYGIYVVTATMLVLGLVAAGSAFAGPRGVWLSNGIGCGAVLLAYSAWQAAHHRARSGR
jgi:hypothetical protein